MLAIQIMAIKNSNYYETLQLNPISADPIIATNPQFAFNILVQLRVREKLWKISSSDDDFEISDVSTGQIYFQGERRHLSLKRKKLLKDNQGHAILNIKNKISLSSKDQSKVFKGDGSEQLMLEIKAENNWIKTKMTTIFKDVVSGAQRKIVLKGNWNDKQYVVFLGEPKQGGIPLAKIYRNSTLRGLISGADDFYLDIAAGVDSALIVTLCLALEEHVKLL